MTLSLYQLSVGLLLAPAVGAIESFRIWQPSEIADALIQWRSEYPNLIKITTSQEAYGLPYAGTREDCPYDGKRVGCLNRFFTIQDFLAHPEGSESSSALPEILWTGSLHGDEQLGPSVVMETASLLLEAASCEAKPSLQSKKWEEEVAEALSCRSDLRMRGIDDIHRQWLARLVATRRIVVVPNANAVGHYRGEHLEDVVDPLEDFPYNNDFSEACMRTIASRTLNEIFLEHMFQLVLSFKGGDDAINYSWGSQYYLSPDSICFDEVAESLSNVVGGRTLFPYGPMNADNNIDSKSRFQDWAYAASWERPRTRHCHPESFDGYDIGKTEYPVSSNRAATFTISSNIGGRSGGQNLGNMMDLIHAEDDSDGLAISRNMRLALVSADLVEPYVSIFGINSLAISEDVVPSTFRDGTICDTSRIVAVPAALETVIVEWTVGGGLNISETELWVARVEDIPGRSVCSLTLGEGFDALSSAFKKIPTRVNGGTGFFSRSGPNPHPKDSVSKPLSLLAEHKSITGHQSNAMGGITTNADVDGGLEGNADNVTSSINLLGPVFRTEISLDDYQVGDRLVLVARAVVDQAWQNTPDGYRQPVVDPQSHLANMRTRPDYEFEISGKKLDGRLHWLSIPVTVIVDDIDRHAGGIELYKRLDEGTNYAKPVTRPLSLIGSDGSSSSSLAIWLYVILAGVTLIFLSLVFLIIRRTRRRRRATMHGKDGITRGDAIVAPKGRDNAAIVAPKGGDNSSVEISFESAVVAQEGSDSSSDVVDFESANIHTLSADEVFRMP